MIYVATSTSMSEVFTLNPAKSLSRDMPKLARNEIQQNIRHLSAFSPSAYSSALPLYVIEQTKVDNPCIEYPSCVIFYIANRK